MFLLKYLFFLQRKFGLRNAFFLYKDFYFVLIFFRDFSVN